MPRTSGKTPKRGKIPEATSKRPRKIDPAHQAREAALRHDLKVTTDAEEQRFEAWCDSFGFAVADVLYDSDYDEWECDPARDTYLRLGWDKRLTASDILAWWERGLQHFEEMKWKPQIKAYKAAIRALKSVCKT